MQRWKYHLILFFFSIPFNLMVFKGWWDAIQNGWANEAYPYLVLFAALAEVYFSKRNLLIAGMVGMGALALGILLRIPHWPGSVLFIIGGITCIMIIPLWNAITSRHKRMLNLIISSWIFLYGLGAIFRIFHWPAAGLLFILSMLSLSIVTIAVGVSLWKLKQEQDERNI